MHSNRTDTGQLTERPDYVPAQWVRWRKSPLNKWVAARPHRVVGWFCVAVPASLLALVLGVLTGDWIWVGVGAFGGLATGAQAVVLCAAGS